ncbi:MAG: hypothetical protein KIH69_011440, partial [Anaerolineae bacterium]|nr:hypothetical protein [Anaerolineae bacterium]
FIINHQPLTIKYEQRGPAEMMSAGPRCFSRLRMAETSEVLAHFDGGAAICAKTSEVLLLVFARLPLNLSAD